MYFLKLDLLRQDIYKQQKTVWNIEAGKKDLKIEVEGNNSKYIMLPIGYDKSTQITMNGKKVKAKPFCEDAFYLIPLEQGNNMINLTFRPQGILIGSFISICGIILLILLHFNKEKVLSCVWAKEIMYIVYNILLKLRTLKCVYAP